MEIKYKKEDEVTQLPANGWMEASAYFQQLQELLQGRKTKRPGLVISKLLKLLNTLFYLCLNPSVSCFLSYLK